jgi:hypothetical protein
VTRRWWHRLSYGRAMGGVGGGGAVGGAEEDESDRAVGGAEEDDELRVRWQPHTRKMVETGIMQ